MNKAIFIQWWLTTTYGQKPRAEHPRWDKRGLISEVWTHFEQGAEISTGRPYITCKDYGQIYAHSPKNGTNIMTRHRERYLPKGKLNQRNIQAAIRTQALRAPPPDKKQLLVTITSLRLPFQIIENQHFRDLLRLTQQAPSLPIIQTGKTLTRQLQSTVQI
ncbi:pyridoxal phosphate-dependent transferase [Penicillium atrosanguineum]|uniref:pyridoxal phosphate-dependent transferase n=1 Tax=Penicillium atrosanguineum TaxID=1132637 RepID=UPI00239802F9|nr:pyridoxal phosphate-dependent transferase [Penicillium atrosanguineum]KAJ5310935.1 pyridoxal phosphate-dependent transferase [Penicillium atrosanguineum]